jgi:hypothetical protein
MLRTLLQRVDAALDGDSAESEEDEAVERFEPASPEP